MTSDSDVESLHGKDDSEDESEDDGEEEVASITEIASLAKAAAPGCKKCQKELDTGEKTRKVHDEHCPRKWRSVGGSYKAQAKKHESVEHVENG